jgi:choice-of-anchor C domain-containing protein
MKKIFLTIICIVALLASFGTVSAANLVVNGGFETPVVVAKYWDTYYAGDTGLTGWTIEKGSIDHVSKTGWESHSGQSIDLAGWKPGKISQTIPTEPGQTYELNFWLAGNSYKEGTETFAVNWDGAEQTQITFDTTGKDIFNNNGGWKLVTLSGLKATTSTTEIAFEQLQSYDDRCGVALDDISVERTVIPTPEFPSVFLPVTFIIGFLGAVLLIQRTRQ